MVLWRITGNDLVWVGGRVRRIEKLRIDVAEKRPYRDQICQIVKMSFKGV
ncbi:hypothetical protein Desdi_0816 [Desulfitobacterium dichloroeliminans LMG P-21439]|uniref:Uncharacterized protein n=1 Tax=Desulfitobacterium dichloroeliminans (strain LMG P-21439 / DCA1) TaxID=871963 RepID=L0F6Q6_DESDL|nr:hypothetical protein Desdi_0816 [Desulfitobacterium dichloroeliminans LMG P-21439]